MLRSDLCDFSDVYIVVNRTIILRKADGRDFIDIGLQHLKTTHQILIAYQISIMH